MANDTVITVIGNLAQDPEMRWTQNGAAVVDFTVATTPRSWDRNANEWKDGDTMYLRCSAWRDMAENIAESLRKGMRVIVTGRLVQRNYTTREGDRRSVLELQVDDVGPSLRWARAQVTRATSNGNGGGGYNQGGNFGGGQGGGYGAPAGGYGQGGDQGGNFSQGSYGAPAGGSDQDPFAAGMQQGQPSPF